MSHNFGPVRQLDADGVGSPGQRTFRLLMAAEGGTASLWLEKEEMRALSVATDQLLARISGHTEWKLYGAPPAPYTPSDSFADNPSVEFKIGQLSIGFETDSRLFALLIHDSQDDPEGPATLSCLATPGQMRKLSRRIESVIAAGRPTCRLCEEPLAEDAHVCVRAN